LPVQADVPWGIALDLDAGKIYWAEPDWCIRQANLDGSGGVCFTGSDPAVDVAWDVAIKPSPLFQDWSLYWSNAWGGTGIWRTGLWGYENVVPGVDAYRVAFYDDGLNVCGNGVVESGEECDDGNDVAGDGCEPDCTETAAPVPAVSPRGLIVAVLLLLATSTVLVRRRGASVRRGLGPPSQYR
jgi:cysteine-rich repeat protein